MAKFIKRHQQFTGVWYVAPKYVGCCDCGLVHRVEYRTKNGKLQSRSWREEFLTKEARKRFKYPMRKRRA